MEPLCLACSNINEYCNYISHFEMQISIDGGT